MKQWHGIFSETNTLLLVQLLIYGMESAVTHYNFYYGFSEILDYKPSKQDLCVPCDMF